MRRSPGRPPAGLPHVEGLWEDTAMIRLGWDSPRTVRRVRLFDRPNPKDHILSGALLFSDGTAIKVGALPNDARSAREIVFPAKTIAWAGFAVDTVSPEISNAGLAEMAVFRDWRPGGEVRSAPLARRARV